ncbi:AIR synthase related protein [Miltoncostaea marina]|uniref:AIR synthase related protein n=1 Tax=Miltoncostaea marina TaxID=2843215 RepID=UPI001C3C4B4D|nr:AIR synthase related protein [Miltoncostaea marina]
MNLPALARLVNGHPGLRGKRDLAAVARALGGDGDDAAVLPGDGAGELVLAAEAIHPAFVAAQPRAAGVAGVVTVLNDLAATGARPVALLDCLVAGAPDAADALLDGLRGGAERYGVPVVGGHATVAPGLAPALATFAVGRARAPLSARNAAPGDAVTLLVCLEGEMLPGEEGDFFSHLRGPRAARAGDDLLLLAAIAEAGDAWAARDVSMPGVAGSLLQLCESAGGLGCALDLDALPAPPGVPLERWLLTFPSYGFLVVGDPAALAARAAAAGLTAARVGTLDDSGRLRLAAGGREEPVWDLAAEPLTGLRADRPGPPGG